MSRKPRAVIEYRIYHLPPQLPIICLTGEHWTISDTLSNHLHFHNCLEIGLCHTESGYMLMENERVDFSAGDLTLVPRHFPHTTCSAPGCRSQWSYLYIDLEQMLRTLQISASGTLSAQLIQYFENWHMIPSQQGERLHQAVRALIEECVAMRPESPRMIQAYSLVLALELERMAAAEPASFRKASSTFVLWPALEYIRIHYMEPCSVEQLAETCHLSETHFRRIFLSVMGITPLRFIIETRIRNACVALDTSNSPITDIANSVGMPSLASFNRNFQSIVGKSPSAYRASGGNRTTNGSHLILPYQGWTEAEEKPGT